MNVEGDWTWHLEEVGLAQLVRAQAAKTCTGEGEVIKAGAPVFWASPTCQARRNVEFASYRACNTFALSLHVPLQPYPHAVNNSKYDYGHGHKP